MPIHNLTITNLRNIHSAELTFDPYLNLIAGRNGSGKTSLLEAIHFLATARSFRTHKSRTLISHHCPSMVIFAQLSDLKHRHIPIGIERTPDTTTVRVSGATINSANQLLGILPVQYLGPESFRVLEQGPAYRRRILDWGVFHVEQSFYRSWYQYEKLVQHRNSLLRSTRDHETILSWDHELARIGEQITFFRINYLNQILPLVIDYLGKLLPEITDYRCRFVQGWPEKSSLLDSLLEYQQRDIRHGHTSVGPHRADLEFIIGKQPAKDILSRGHQKLLIAAFRLAQLVYHNTISPDRRCVIMLDDLLSELDQNNASNLLELTLKSGSQIFMTTLESTLPARIQECISKTSKNLFHVEQGEIRAI